MIELYIDSDCIYDSSTGIGAWTAIIVINGKENILYDYAKQTNQIRMEMIAITEALKWIRDHKLINKTIRGYTNMQLVAYCFNGKWKRKKNKDLWEIIYKLKKGLDIKFQWINWHNNNNHGKNANDLSRTIVQRAKYVEKTKQPFSFAF